MGILLNDEEIKQAMVEADKEIWSFKAHPRWEGEKYLMKAQLKKIVELFRQQEGEKITDDTYYRISERLLQAMLKEAE